MGNPNLTLMTFSTSPLPFLPPPPPAFAASAAIGTDQHPSRTRIGGGGSLILRRPVVRVSSDNLTPTASTSSSSSSSSVVRFENNLESSLGFAGSASDVVRAFYAGINRHDLACVEGLIAENCVYEDLIFPRPFIGRHVPSLSLSMYKLCPDHLINNNFCKSVLMIEI